MEKTKMEKGIQVRAVQKMTDGKIVKTCLEKRVVLVDRYFMDYSSIKKEEEKDTG